VFRKCATGGALIVQGSQSHIPSVTGSTGDLDLPRPTAYRTVLHIPLVASATLVEEDFGGLPTIGASGDEGLGHFSI